ncbi:MAG: hypothetical protein WAL63_18705 [Solirubrobacteraceae bacterium]
MRGAVVATGLAAVSLAVVSPAPARALGPKQISAAVSRAERSSSLWATVNICDSRKYPNALGIRGQMPTLGFSASLSMAVQINYWSPGKKRFEPIKAPGATATQSLGTESSGLQQAGSVFKFKPHTGMLNATVTFTWTRGGKVLGRVQRQTTAGHPGADYGSPPRYSAAACRIA